MTVSDSQASTPTAPDGRKLLRLEVRNAQTPIERKPKWIKTRATMGPEYPDMSAFDAIVPCGIADAGVTSLALEAGHEITVDEVLVDVVDAVRSAFDHRDVGADVIGVTDPQSTVEPGVASVR